MTEEYAHGTNPIFLIDKIVRTKIYACVYYKEKCFALDAKTIIDKAVELKCIGGTCGGSKKPTAFLCLLLKLLKISPEREIVQKYIESNYKYLRALGCMYLRLVGKPDDIYLTLESLYNDYCKLRIKLPDGSFSTTYMDEFVDDLLVKDIYLETVLPKIPKRHTLEDNEGLEPRVSVLDGELTFVDGDLEEEQFPDSSSIGRSKKKAKLGEGGQNPQKAPAPESDEYWINLRKQLGLAPVKEPNK
ncbi:hypothetical protein SteCoe_31997 [Stentor coeruleus]|uniref:Pre-mRNA-splicing factor 38 n=1 Tax=Stentor coeruleus TaxID=5963 RepID=A0A1R2AZY6_9CILI|nr:hypothetical protein SteCoe_31997 [Stentor coeruleus]